MTPDRPRLLVATTIPETAWTLMRGQLRYLRENGYDVELVTSPGPLLDRIAERESIRVHGLPMARELSLQSDVRAVAKLIRLVRRIRPDITFVGTPKAGLVGGVAAWLCRVPRRIYLLRGLRLETERGLRRAVLWMAEWVALHVSHEVIAVSPSLLARARQLRLLGRSRGMVLGAGSSTGIDPARFAATPEAEAAGRDLRATLGIPPSAFVFGFVGRLVVDKGIAELVGAFERLQRQRDDVWLLVVGAEELAGLPVHVRQALADRSNVRFTGWVEDTVPPYYAMDCLVLPTYREGFPNVPMEAAAAGRPVITTKATGAVDSIRDEETGLLVNPRSALELSDAMLRLVLHRELAQTMGARGRDFVMRNFTNKIVWQNLLDHLQARSSAR